MVQEVRPGVVRIETSEVSGSGVIIDTNSDGEALILTNHHVIENSIHIKVEVDDSRVFQGYVRGFDADVDLALLRICCGDFTTLEFGSASGVKPGSEVIAIGYPLDLPGEASVSRGIVSAVRSEGDFEVIQMDAPINPGSSGGPLLSEHGRVLGINTFSFTKTEGLGFAISERTIQAVLPQLRRQTLLANAVSTTPTRIPTATPRPTPSTPGLYFDAYGNIVTPTWMVSATPAATATPIPTSTPYPTATATAWPTATAIPTPTFQPTAIPTPGPTVTPIPTPVPIPTAAPPPPRGDFFTRGSSQDDVLHVQGTPQGVNLYEASRKEVWSYDYSSVTFSLPNERVTEWNDISGNLRVRLLPKTSHSQTPGYFTRGSTQDDVLHFQGTPQGVNVYEASRKEVWSYDYSSVTFSLPNERVTEWNDISGNLRVRLLPKTSHSQTPGYFTRGSTQDDVLHVQGTPQGVNLYEALRKEVWSYDYSSVTFSLPNERVTEWNNISGNLKIR